MTPGPAWARTVTLLAATLVAVVLLVLVSLPNLGISGLTHLDGPIAVEVWHDGVPQPARTIQLPGLFTREDLPADARIRARWSVDIPEDTPGEAWAVWLERPQYASRVSWDDVVVGHTGDIDGTVRAERSLLATLPRPPDWQGPHELAVEVQGDYGRGGLIGRMVVGPQADVVSYALAVEAEHLGLVLLLSGIGLVQVFVSAGARPRIANLFFGCLCLALAAYLFCRTDLASSMALGPETIIRVRRVVTPLFIPLALGLAVTFEGRPIPRWLWVIVGVCGPLALGGVLLPMVWLPILEALLDVGLLMTILGMPLVVIPIALRRRPGGLVLALATIAPLLLGTLIEILVTNGFVSGTSGILPATALFAVGTAAALSVRDATEGERHRRLIQGSPDALLGVGIDGRVTDANPAAEALLGRSPLGTQLQDWVVQDDQALLRAQLSRESHGPDRAELRIRGQDRVIESVVTPLDDSTMLLLLRDVTARRELDRTRLQRARMETLALLVGSLSHDFNNMLGTLLAHVGFLQLTQQQNAPVVARLGRMEATLLRASALNRRLLSFAGGPSASLAPTRLHEVVRAAVDLVEPTIPERVEVKVDVPEVLPDVAAAAPDLEHVFVNVLMNARNALGLTGTITISARVFTDDVARGVICAVEDTGPGVPIDQHEAIFSPFITGQDTQGGSGLGLAVARQVVREHHGRIWLENRPGGGARVCIVLHEASALRRAVPAEIPAGSRILLVEDDPDQRDAWSSTFERLGCEVETAADGPAAVACLDEHGAPDVLITDLLLPGLDGLQLVRLARGRFEELPILLVSAHLPAREQLDDVPLLTCLEKPLRLTQLVAHVAALLGDGDVDDPDSGSWPSLEHISWESARWHSPPPAGPTRTDSSS